MGMFDFVHFEGNQYQTKDTPCQLMDNYEIRDDGTLWHEEYDTEWIDVPDLNLFGGRLDQSNLRWTRCNAFDGVIRFSREDEARGGWKNNAWIEYEALFMDGCMIKLQQTRGQEPLTAWYKQGVVDLQQRKNDGI
jgi:hypothetical protein